MNIPTIQAHSVFSRSAVMNFRTAGEGQGRGISRGMVPNAAEDLDCLYISSMNIIDTTITESTSRIFRGTQSPRGVGASRDSLGLRFKDILGCCILPVWSPCTRPPAVIQPSNSHRSFLPPMNGRMSGLVRSSCAAAGARSAPYFLRSKARER